MNIRDTIATYIEGQPEPKRAAMESLHRLAMRAAPKCRLWFSDGKDESGKTVSNPTIGYGLHTMRYAAGSTKDVFRVSVSANATGISIYVLGLEDKSYLKKTFAKSLGKASVTGYCVRFKSLGDVDVEVLERLLRFGLGTRASMSAAPVRKKAVGLPRKKRARIASTKRKK